MANNLTQKQVRTAPTLQLAMRFNRLIQMGETAPVHVATMADAKEMLWIEDELRRRLLVAIGHDFYPPDGVAKPTVAEMKTRIKAAPKPKPVYHATQVIHPCSAGVIKKAEAEIKTQGNCMFNIIIISSIGSTAAKKTVKVDTKGDAIAVAENMIKTLGLKKATYKIT